ncbi:MAG TPA: type II toxin-antitoxin system ParD family antitoxin [Beijerinckiaceae bacterium]|jgi:antitoxin ParD1/3/4
MSKHYVLDREEEALAEDLVASGRFANVDEVVREGMRLIGEQERQAIRTLDDLREAWEAGINSGEPVDADQVFDRLSAKYDAMARMRSR